MELASVGKGILIGLGVLGLMGVGLTLGIHFFHAHLSVACLATSLGVSGSVAVAGWGGLALFISALRLLKNYLKKVKTGSQQIADNIRAAGDARCEERLEDNFNYLREAMQGLSNVMDISSQALSRTLHNNSSLTLEETQNLTEIYTEIIMAMFCIKSELKQKGLESSVCPLVEFDRKTCHDCLDKFIDKLKGVANLIKFQAERTFQDLADQSMGKGISGDIFRGNQLILPNGEEVIPQDVWARTVEVNANLHEFNEEIERLKKMMTPVATSVTGEQNAEDELTKKNLEDCLLKLKKHSIEKGDSGTQTQVAEAIIEALHQYFPETVEDVPGLDSVHAIDILFCQASGNDLQSFGTSALSELGDNRFQSRVCADLSKKTITSRFEVASQDGSDGIRVEARYDLKKVKHDHISKLSWQGQFSIERLSLNKLGDVGREATSNIRSLLESTITDFVGVRDQCIDKLIASLDPSWSSRALIQLPSQGSWVSDLMRGTTVIHNGQAFALRLPSDSQADTDAFNKVSDFIMGTLWPARASNGAADSSEKVFKKIANGGFSAPIANLGYMNLKVGPKDLENEYPNYFQEKRILDLDARVYKTIIQAQSSGRKWVEWSIEHAFPADGYESDATQYDVKINVTTSRSGQTPQLSLTAPDLNDQSEALLELANSNNELSAVQGLSDIESNHPEA